MSALLAMHGLVSPDRDRVLSMFRRQNPGPEELFRTGDLEVIVTGNGRSPTTARDAGGAFIAAAGVLMYRGHIGNAALQRLLKDVVSDQIDEGALDGAFTALSWNGRQVRVFTDWLGNLCAYRNEAGTVWSTSFLTAAVSYPQHRLDRQGAWEYIFQGASCGESTVLERIRRIDPASWHDPISGSKQARRDLLPRQEIEEAPFDQVVDQAVRALDGVFDCIANHYGNRIDTALSGGYDSRLILAALRARGLEPRVHVYGKSTDSDVVIAKAIAAAEGFEIEHTDKATLTRSLDRESLAEAIERNFIAFDGLSLDGIFDAGADLLTRQHRMHGGHLALNGGGGEVFRNFFYFPDRPVALDDLLTTFYSRFDPMACSHHFDARQYRQNLGEKVVAALKTEARDFQRVDVERAYPLFRCRYWMAPTVSINNRLGQALTPLVHIPAVAAGLRVPIRFKNSGRLEAAMIGRFDANLARHRSSYRSSMIGAPSLAERMRDYATLARPIWVRKLSYRVRQRYAAPTAYAAWMHTFGSFLPESWGIVRDLVIPENMRDVEPLRRTATLQFLCSAIGVGPSSEH